MTRTSVLLWLRVPVCSASVLSTHLLQLLQHVTIGGWLSVAGWGVALPGLPVRKPRLVGCPRGLTPRGFRPVLPRGRMGHLYPPPPPVEPRFGYGAPSVAYCPRPGRNVDPCPRLLCESVTSDRWWAVTLLPPSGQLVWGYWSEWWPLSAVPLVPCSTSQHPYAPPRPACWVQRPGLWSSMCVWRGSCWPWRPPPGCSTLPSRLGTMRHIVLPPLLVGSPMPLRAVVMPTSGSSVSLRGIGIPGWSRWRILSGCRWCCRCGWPETALRRKGTDQCPIFLPTRFGNGSLLWCWTVHGTSSPLPGLASLCRLAVVPVRPPPLDMVTSTWPYHNTHWSCVVAPDTRGSRMPTTFLSLQCGALRCGGGLDILRWPVVHWHSPPPCCRFSPVFVQRAPLHGPYSHLVPAVALFHSHTYTTVRVPAGPGFPRSLPQVFFPVFGLWRS